MFKEKVGALWSPRDVRPKKFGENVKKRKKRLGL
jgi:hypothetical protein